MTPEAFATICDWDAKCTAPEEVMFGTTKDRRRLIEYVKELQAAAPERRWEALGRAGITVSVCYGALGVKGCWYSVDALHAESGASFDRPYMAASFAQAIAIVEKESLARGWLGKSNFNNNLEVQS